MNRWTVGLAFLGLSSLSNSVTVFNTTNGNIGLTDQISNRLLMGDGGDTVAAPAGMKWRIDSVSLFLSYLTGTYAQGDIRVRIRIYDGFNPAAPNPNSVFSSLLKEFTYEPAPHSSNANAILLSGPTLVPGGALLSGTRWGVDLAAFQRNASNPNQFDPSINVSLAGSSTTSNAFVGSSPSGFYADNNFNGSLQASELVQTSSPPVTNAVPWQGGIRLDATAVPEPSVLVALAIPVLFRLRRKR